TIVLSNQDCQCGTEYGETKPYRAEFLYSRFLEIRMEDLSVVAHELTHVQTPISGYRYFRSQVEGKDRRVEKSPWYDRINQILGVQDVFEARDKLGERYRKNTEELYNKLPSFPTDHTDIDKLPFEERERYYFYERLSDVLWDSYTAIGEFVAFLSENYVKGKAYFNRRVGELFSEEEYQKVYNFVRDEIFHGREYPVP
ncbi:MAG: hypothetical protein Q8Q92_01555, partial [bacterium]|nr:hypothetical protein [bacterium]